MKPDTLYFYSINGNQSGPVTLDKLRELVRNGTIPPLALIWSEGWSDWFPLAESAQLLAMPVAPARAAMPSATVKKDTRTQSLLVAAMIVACLCALALFVAQRAPKNPRDKYRPDFKYVQDYVKSRSLAPTTVVFCDFSEVVIEEKVNKATLGGTFTASNAYGVPIRSYWTATVRDTGREVEILGP